MRIGILRELSSCEDWDYWLRAALQDYSFIRVASYGFKHHEHEASLSKHKILVLRGRVKFLQLWLDNIRLNAVLAAAVRHELARTSFSRYHVPFPLVVPAWGKVEPSGTPRRWRTYVQAVSRPLNRLYEAILNDQSCLHSGTL